MRKYTTPCRPFNITVIEKTSRIGGRSTTVAAFGDPRQPLEVGASIFIKANRNLYETAKDFKLPLKDADSDRPKESSQALGIWDGSRFRFVGHQTLPWFVDRIKLLWQYGLSPVRTQRLVRRSIAAFLQLYESPQFPFQSLQEVIEVVGLKRTTATVSSVLLKGEKIYAPFSNEIIQVSKAMSQISSCAYNGSEKASTRVNYASNIDQIHGMGALVCMATDGALAVREVRNPYGHRNQNSFLSTGQLENI